MTSSRSARSGRIATSCAPTGQRPTAVVVDPGADAAEIRLSLARSGATCAAILLTHSHYDHIGALADLAEGTGAPVWLPQGELDVFRRPNDFFPGISVRAFEGEATLLAGGETVEAAGISFQVLHVPGHSPGHVSYYADGCLFSGDVLFAGSVGRTDLPFGDWETLVESIRSLDRRLPARDGRLLGARAADDARRRARPQSVPRRASRVKIQRPRGTHDILPSEQPLWQRVTGEMERLCALYGYRRIQTPVFEDTELFARTSGAGSDIVQKEMYTFTDRSDRSLTLRPEGTAPICRAYIEHGLHKEPQPQKLYTIGSMYRYGRPGRGRYSEHWQLSVEAIGTEDPAIDAEIIQLYDTLLRRLGIKEYRLELNSIGCRECRPAYLETLRAWLAEHEDELDADAREKAATSPLRVFDVKSPATRKLLEAAPKIGESLCAACVEHFAAVRADLDATGVALRARADARARARLLLPHHLGVHRADGQRELDHLRRRPLRLSGRGDRRPADTRGRLRRRDRAAADRDGGRGRRRPRRRRPSTSSSPASRTRRASWSRRSCATCATWASPRTPTTPAGRSRAS